MATNESANTHRKARRNWATITVVMTFAATTGGVLLYWIGAAARSAYLRELNVPGEGFKLVNEQLIQIGVRALFDVAGNYPSIIGRNLGVTSILLLAVFILTAQFFWPVANRGPRTFEPRKKALVIATVVTSILPMTGMILALFAIIIIGVPAVSGHQAGVEWARELRRTVCTPRSPEPCVELWRGQELIGCGSVVTQSDSRIAFLDAQRGRTQVLALEGTETIGVDRQSGEEAHTNLCLTRPNVVDPPPSPGTTGKAGRQSD